MDKAGWTPEQVDKLDVIYIQAMQEFTRKITERQEEEMKKANRYGRR